MRNLIKIFEKISVKQNHLFYITLVENESKVNDCEIKFI